MNTEPIIIEQPLHTQPAVSNSNGVNQQLFFTILDKVEQYDSISTKIRIKYQQAMLSLASIKFQDPHSLNINAHKCIPALLKLSNKNSLQYSYDSFTHPAEQEDVYPEQFEQQIDIQKTCQSKQHQLEKMQKQSEKNEFCERQILHRFNVLNNQDKVISASHQFKQLLQLLLQMQSFKNQFESNIQKIQAAK